ncbi:MAG: serralysin [Methylobacteriaceae bacterium]|jgi:hypothetical protein|nr:serralysin [Methylobacteriaceae bacterium]
MLNRSSSPVQVNLTQDVNENVNSVIHRDDGSAWVFYSPTGGTTLHARLTDAAGTPTGGEISFDLPAVPVTSVLIGSQPVLLGDGTFVILTTTSGVSGAVNSLQHYSAAGQALGSPTMIPTPSFSSVPTLMSRPDGGFDMLQSVGTLPAGSTFPTYTTILRSYSPSGQFQSQTQIGGQTTYDPRESEAFTSTGDRIFYSPADETILLPGATSPVRVSIPGLSPDSDPTISAQLECLQVAPDGSVYVAVTASQATVDFSNNAFTFTTTRDELAIFHVQANQPATTVATISGPTGISQNARLGIYGTDLALLGDNTFAIETESSDSSDTTLRQYSLSGVELDQQVIASTWPHPSLEVLPGNSIALVYSQVPGPGGPHVSVERLSENTARLPTHNDFNGDGMSDVFWRSVGGSLVDWTMNGSTITSGQVLTSNGQAVSVESSWQVAGIGDFNGDGMADVFWRNADGSLVNWTMNGSTITSGQALTSDGQALVLDSSWHVLSTDDFNDDGDADIIWQSSSGALYEWTMNGSTVTSGPAVTSNGQALTLDTSWHVVATGDFNGDGDADIIWQNTSGVLDEWTMDGSTVTSGPAVTSNGQAITLDSSWHALGTGDFNGDGNDDIIWQNTNGALYEWMMNGSTITSSEAPTSNGQVVTPDASWHVAGIADFNHDGHADLLWQNDSGSLLDWTMNGSTIASGQNLTFQGQAVNPIVGWTTQH